MDPTINQGILSGGQHQATEQQEQLRDMCSSFLQIEARERLDRIFIANPILATQVYQIIASQVQTGQIAPKSIDDQTVKEILQKLQEHNQPQEQKILKHRIDPLENVQDLGDSDLSF